MKKYQEILNRLFPNQYLVLEDWDEKDPEYEVLGIWNLPTYLKEGEDPAEKLKGYSPEFTICKCKEGYFFTYVVTRQGGYWDPPEYDIIEDKTMYPDYQAFMALIHHIIDETFAWHFELEPEVDFPDEYGTQ